MAKARTSDLGEHGVSGVAFEPWDPLLGGVAAPTCGAVVVIPAKDEEAGLEQTLDALAAQVDLGHVPLRPGFFEVLLLLNNCVDDSPRVARRWAGRHPEVVLHVIERQLAPEEAHVGTARRMLMDTAWRRVQGRDEVVAMISTDADTLVAEDWVARNLAALEAGADAVGGAIGLRTGEMNSMAAPARAAYVRDRRYQRLVAELEDWLDPQAGDPWPRHLEHFGASLACTPEIYQRAGGLPAVKPLEDVAFVGRLRAAGARLRHDPAVKVFTSARVDGRVEVGLSGQLKIWEGMCSEEQRVLSAAWLAHRFERLRGLREVWAGRGELDAYEPEWRRRMVAALEQRLCEAEFLGEIDSDSLIEAMFCGEKEGRVVAECRELVRMLRVLRRPLRRR